MVRIQKITPEEVDVYYNGELKGSVNEYEFNDLRIQILKEKAEGWSVRPKHNSNHDYPIDKNGRLDWNKYGKSEFFELFLDQLSQIR